MILLFKFQLVFQIDLCYCLNINYHLLIVSKPNFCVQILYKNICLSSYKTICYITNPSEGANLGANNPKLLLQQYNGYHGRNVLDWTWEPTPKSLHAWLLYFFTCIFLFPCDLMSSLSTFILVQVLLDIVFNYLVTQPTSRIIIWTTSI